MIAKGFDCSRCNKKIVCKYIDKMQECYSKCNDIYLEYTDTGLDQNDIPIIGFEFKCLEYVQSGGLSSR